MVFYLFFKKKGRKCTQILYLWVLSNTNYLKKYIFSDQPTQIFRNFTWGQCNNFLTAERFQNGGDAMADIVHDFCTEVFSTLIPPNQWTISITVILPKKGDLSLMTNYRGVSLLSITARAYNKILLNRIRDHVDPILRSNQARFCSGRSCTQQIHILRRIMEGFQDYQLPLYNYIHWLQEGLWLHQKKGPVCRVAVSWDT